MDYFADCGCVKGVAVDVMLPLNPLGIKGAGEAGVIPGAAVFASAISDAEGFPITAMPISPSDLFELRQHHRPRWAW
jgi:CO/xanthine dehydrogenase Mo-binding subunit